MDQLLFLPVALLLNSLSDLIKLEQAIFRYFII